jgi:hypothetical protein
MSRRSFAWFLGCSCLVPVIILATASSHPAQLSWFAWALHMVLYSMYLVAPHVIFGILAVSVAPTLLRVALPAVIALNLALVCFLIWIWSLAPYGEDGSASVLYIPIWATIVATAFVIARVLTRRASRIQQQPGETENIQGGSR